MKYVKYIIVGIALAIIAIIGALCFNSPQTIRPADYIDVRRI